MPPNNLLPAPEEPVVIVPYDPQWPLQFDQERRLLAAALGDHALVIEHFGSTSVPGLCAKPVIDILVLVAEFEPDQFYIDALAPLGYFHHNWQDQPEHHLFFRKGTPRTHHLHIVRQGGAEHLRHLAFRNYLRRHPAVADEYARLKLDLAEKYANQREIYTESKTGFIRQIEAKAMRGEP